MMLFVHKVVVPSCLVSPDYSFCFTSEREGTDMRKSSVFCLCHLHSCQQTRSQSEVNVTHLLACIGHVVIQPFFDQAQDRGGQLARHDLRRNRLVWHSQ